MGIWCWRMILIFVAVIVLCPKHSASKKHVFIKNARWAPSVSYEEYEYVIIGGGTAGCPLAATLSQNHKVLVLERGGSPYGNPNITNLDAFGAALSDTSPSSPAQRFVSQEGVINSRARVLGGGTCLNAGFYTRASAHYIKEAGWDEKLVAKSYEWVERVVAFQPIVRSWQSAVRAGLLEVGVVPYNGFTFDHVGGTKVGGTIFDQHGHRHTAADLLEYANPTKLTVLLHATVYKILFTNRGRSKPVANGVIFRDELGAEHRVYLKQGRKSEVIVSAGALGSPQLLMLSGIGAAHELREHKIGVVLNQPLVGQGMMDNPMNAIFVPSPIPVEVSLIEVVGITGFGSYIEAASGENFTSRSPRDYGMFSPKIGQFSKVPPKQRTPKVVAKAIEMMGRLEPAAFRGGFILEKIMGPISRGYMQLNTTDPNDNPLVTFNYFKDPRDLKRCVEGINTIEKVIESKAFSRFRYHNMSASMLLNMTANSPVNLLPKHSNTSTSLDQFCRDTVMTIWHYHGGCQLGTVVDSHYKVIGLDALRIIDGSTFNYSPGTNPQATVMMLGRYMGLKILKERLAE